jgi:ribosomal protein S18 acetylase RimI-like enzyme
MSFAQSAHILVHTMTAMPRPEQRTTYGMYEVPPDHVALFRIEAVAAETTPGIVDTGSEEDFTRFLCKGGAPRAFVSHNQAGDAVGYIALSALTGTTSMEVRSLAVLPEYHRQGHGKFMMLEAETIAKTAGRNTMMLATSPVNIGAVKFYRALGYCITKEVGNYYGDGTPRYILEKQLAPS